MSLKKGWIIQCDRCPTLVAVLEDDLRKAPKPPDDWFVWDAVKPPQHLCPECLARAVEDSAPTLTRGEFDERTA